MADLESVALRFDLEAEQAQKRADRLEAFGNSTQAAAERVRRDTWGAAAMMLRDLAKKGIGS